MHINKAMQSFDPITGLEIIEAGAPVGSAGEPRAQLGRVTGSRVTPSALGSQSWGQPVVRR